MRWTRLIPRAALPAFIAVLLAAGCQCPKCGHDGAASFRSDSNVRIWDETKNGPAQAGIGGSDPVPVRSVFCDPNPIGLGSATDCTIILENDAPTGGQVVDVEYLLDYSVLENWSSHTMKVIPEGYRGVAFQLLSKNDTNGGTIVIVGQSQGTPDTDAETATLKVVP